MNKKELIKEIIDAIALGLGMCGCIMMLFAKVEANEQVAMLGVSYKFSSSAHEHTSKKVCRGHDVPQTIGVHVGYKWVDIDEVQTGSSELAIVKTFSKPSACSLQNWYVMGLRNFPQQSQDGYIEAGAGIVLSGSNWRKNETFRGTHLGGVVSLGGGTNGDQHAYVKAYVTDPLLENHTDTLFTAGVASKTRKHDYKKDRTETIVLVEQIPGPPGNDGEDGRDGRDGDKGDKGEDGKDDHGHGHKPKPKPGKDECRN